MSKVSEIVSVLFGRAPGCEWARERLPRYWGFDLPMREFKAMESHLHLCPECAAVYEPIKKFRDMQADVEHAKPGLDTPEVGYAKLMAWTEAAKAEEAARDEAQGAGAWPGRRAVLAAAASLLVVVGSLFVYSSRQAVQDLERLPAEAKLAVADTQTPPETAPPAPVDFGNLDAIVAQSFIEAKVEAELAHTEEEYEAWAREEYPHIMWLHDFLTDPENGINWEPGPIERSEDAGHPDERFTQASLGWRKLLIDSGEVFKFDFPETVGEPGCAPSIEGLQLATAVAGYGLELAEDGAWLLPELDYAEGALPAKRFNLYATDTPSLPVLVNSEIPSDYAMTLSKNVALARSALRYLCASSRLANLTVLDSLTTQACDARVMIASVEGREVCDTNAWRTRFSTVFLARSDALASLNERLRVDIATLSSSAIVAYPGLAQGFMKAVHAECNVSTRALSFGDFFPRSS